MNQCWNIVHWTPRNKLQWNVNRNSYIFIQENPFANVVWKMVAMLSRPQCVKENYSILFAIFSVFWILMSTNVLHYVVHRGLHWTVGSRTTNCAHTRNRGNKYPTQKTVQYRRILPLLAILHPLESLQWLARSQLSEGHLSAWQT